MISVPGGVLLVFCCLPFTVCASATTTVTRTVTLPTTTATVPRTLTLPTLSTTTTVTATLPSLSPTPTATVTLPSLSTARTVTVTLPTTTSTESVSESPPKTATLTTTRTITLPTSTSTVARTVTNTRTLSPTVTTTITLGTETDSATDTYVPAPRCNQQLCGVPLDGIDGVWNWAGMSQCAGETCTVEECCSEEGNPWLHGDEAAWAPEYTFHQQCLDEKFDGVFPGGENNTIWGYVSMELDFEKCGEACKAEPQCEGFKWSNGVCQLADRPLDKCGRAIRGEDCNSTSPCEYARRTMLPWYMPFTDTNATFSTSLPLSDITGSCGGSALVAGGLLNMSATECQRLCDDMDDCVAITWRLIEENPLLRFPGYVPKIRDFAYSECQLWSTVRCKVPDYVCLGDMEPNCPVINDSNPIVSAPLVMNGSIATYAGPSDALALINSQGLCPDGGPCFYLARNRRHKCFATLMKYLFFWGPMVCLAVMGLLASVAGVWYMYSITDREQKDPAAKCCNLCLIFFPLLLVMILPWIMLPAIRTAMIYKCPGRTNAWWGPNIRLPTLDGLDNFTGPPLPGSVVVTWSELVKPANSSTCGLKLIGNFWSHNGDCFSPGDWGSIRLPGELRDIQLTPGMPTLGMYDFKAYCTLPLNNTPGVFFGGRVIDEGGSHPEFGLVRQYKSKDKSCDAAAWEILSPSLTKAEAVAKFCEEENATQGDIHVELECSHCVWLLWPDVMNAPFLIMAINSCLSLFAASIVEWIGRECSEGCGSEDPDQEQEENTVVLWLLMRIPCLLNCACRIERETFQEALTKVYFEMLTEGETIWCRQGAKDGDLIPAVVEELIDGEDLDQAEGEFTERSAVGLSFPKGFPR
eukprot:Hpha_TRINITY_DN426_c0_g1::TRINITY_DN426_c0_g1_i1::g.27763::m.27763